MKFDKETNDELMRLRELEATAHAIVLRQAGTRLVSGWNGAPLDKALWSLQGEIEYLTVRLNTRLA
jgi:ribosomal protein L27